MAVVTGFKRVSTKSTLHPTSVVCHWSMVEGAEPLLQLTTHGSATREQPGKPSQTLQFTNDTAKELVDILRREFRFT